MYTKPVRIDTLDETVEEFLMAGEMTVWRYVDLRCGGIIVRERDTPA